MLETSLFWNVAGAVSRILATLSTVPMATVAYRTGGQERENAERFVIQSIGYADMLEREAACIRQNVDTYLKNRGD